MNYVADTVAEFGRSIGLDPLEIPDDRALVLGLEAIGILAIERSGPQQESVVVSLARRLHRPDELDLRILLGGAHYRARLARPIQVGLLRDDVVMSVVLPQEEFSLNSLNDVIRLLDEEQSKLEANR